MRLLLLLGVLGLSQTFAAEPVLNFFFKDSEGDSLFVSIRTSPSLFVLFRDVKGSLGYWRGSDPDKVWLSLQRDCGVCKSGVFVDSSLETYMQKAVLPQLAAVPVAVPPTLLALKERGLLTYKQRQRYILRELLDRKRRKLEGVRVKQAALHSKVLLEPLRKSEKKETIINNDYFSAVVQDSDDAYVIVSMDEAKGAGKSKSWRLVWGDWRRKLPWSGKNSS